MKDKFARFIGWARSSAFGHVVLFGLPFLVAEVAAFGVMAYLDGTLSFGAIVRLSLIFGPLGAAGALLVWYMLTLPRITRRRNKGTGT